MVRSRSQRKPVLIDERLFSTDFSEDLESMFDMPVRRTYELLSKQLKEARKSKKVTMKV